MAAISSNYYTNNINNANIIKEYNHSKKANLTNTSSITPSFKAITYSPNPPVRTQLTTKEEFQKYSELTGFLDKNYRNKLDYALKSGKLLNDMSENKSTVLDNLHKIASTQRVKGLNNKIILQECLDIISNPYVITQVGEDIPQEYKNYVIDILTNKSTDKRVRKNTDKFLDNIHMGTCPTASIEFDLATKQPAEFFRIVEGLTSPGVGVYKTIDNDALNENTLETIWLLKTFKAPVQKMNYDKTTILLKPDRNAIIRARIQNSHKDKGERSIIDILMQSTMMQLGSRQTYNSLTDIRKPTEWSDDNGGLINFEKTFVESVMENKTTTCVDYQILDENGKLIKYTKPFKEIKKDLNDALNQGYNVIIGYTWEEPDSGYRINGHEITIIGTTKASNGEIVYICQDSDDEFDKPILMPESFLIPNLHHAGLPDEIASRSESPKESWEYSFQEL